MSGHAQNICMGSLLSLPDSRKRSRASSAPCESEQERSRKRPRPSKGKQRELSPLTLLDDLSQELKCGCCTELLYNPVVVNPCQHYFCGSCCILWVRNGGTNCPACRSISTSVTPSRILQSMIDLLLRSDPSKARPHNERAQADQIYRAGSSLRLPTPRPLTPEPNLEPANDNFARPCPTCPAGNPHGWRCPVPIPDPALDHEHAVDLDDGMPTGHNFCGNCDQLHNIHAPTSSKCDMCQVSFCGVGIPGRCCAIGLAMQQPHDMSDLQDLILSTTLYQRFGSNSVEIDILIDYLRVNEISLRAVYKEIISQTLQKPDGFISLINIGIFDDVHPIPGGDDPDPTAPRRRICRLCAAQVLIYGLKDWWVHERKQANLPDEVVARKDCPEGNACNIQDDQVHAKEFNHIIQPPPPPAQQDGDPPPVIPSFLLSAHIDSSSPSAPERHEVEGMTQSGSGSGSHGVDVSVQTLSTSSVREMEQQQHGDVVVDEGPEPEPEPQSEPEPEEAIVQQEVVMEMLGPSRSTHVLSA